MTSWYDMTILIIIFENMYIVCIVSVNTTSSVRCGITLLILYILKREKYVVHITDLFYLFICINILIGCLIFLSSRVYCEWLHSC